MPSCKTRVDAVRPYDPHDGVNVVRHNNKFVELNFCPNTSAKSPFLPYSLAERIQLHFGLDHLAEQMLLFVCTDSNKIFSGPGIVMPVQPNRPAPICFGSAFHANCILQPYRVPDVGGFKAKQ